MPLLPYNQNEELEAIQRRYELISQNIPITLQNLKKSPEFSETLRRLRQDQWKDWHILLAIHNGVLNYRLEFHGINERNHQDAEAMARQVYKELSEQGETETDMLVPISNFSYEKMQIWLDSAIMYTLKIKGMEFKAVGYDFTKLRKIVAQKYHYFELDTPHDCIF